MPIFGNKKRKDLWEYLPDYDPRFDVDEPPRIKYIEDTVSVVHKNLMKELLDYWDLLHPLVQDVIWSWVKVYDKLAKGYKEAEERLETERRKTVLEMQNVEELQDQINELKKTLQNETVLRKDLEERLKDQTEIMKANFEKERRTLEMLASTNLNVPADKIHEAIQEILPKIGSPEEVERLEKKVKELEEKIERERAENQKIQMEIAQSFQEKILRMDQIIRTLKEQAGITDEEMPSM